MDVYRDGKGHSLRERIQEAVKDFYHRHNALPAVMVVHPSEAEAARDALAALGLKVRLEVSGGCLVPEVWLGVEEE